MAAVFGLNMQPHWGAYPNVSGYEFAGDTPALDPINDGGTGWGGRKGGVPVDGANFPKRLTWAHVKRKPPADFESSPEPTVSERAKAVIEGLEPGVHQFFPIDFISTKGEIIERRYWLVVGNRIDSVDREHTTMVLYKDKMWRPVQDMIRRGEPIPSHLSPDTNSVIVFNLAAIGSAHIWKDKHLDGASMWISETTVTRFQEEGLTGLEWRPRDRIDAV